MYLLVSALKDRFRWLTFALAFIDRRRIVAFARGGESGTLLYALPFVSEALFETMRCCTLRGRCVTVEFPMSCRIQTDSRRSKVGERNLSIEGDTFSTSDDPFILVVVDQLLEVMDFGDTFLIGTAAPRNPALRSCSFLACFELLDGESVRGEPFRTSCCCPLSSRVGELSRLGCRDIIQGRYHSNKEHMQNQS